MSFFSGFGGFGGGFPFGGAHREQPDGTHPSTQKTIKLTTRPSTKFLKFQKMPPRTISRNSTGNSQKSTTLIDPTAMPKKYTEAYLVQKNIRGL
mgnify:CR=1 FL=1|jgi:hypothetical protein